MAKSSAPKWVATTLLACLIFGACLAVLAPTAQAGGKGNPNPGILPPNSKATGMSYAELHAKWWEWILSYPWESNPNNIEGEYDASMGITGNLCLLPGTFGGAVTRTAHIPTGKMLFFPLVNWAYIATPPYGDPPWSPEHEAEVRAMIAAAMDNAVPFCEIDGKPVNVAPPSPYRTQSTTLIVTSYFGWNPYEDPEAIYPWTLVDDGYYLLLPPLPAGQHTIHFGGAIGEFSVDVTYEVTVGGSGEE